MKTAEQQARDMLERIGVEDVQSFTSGDLVELANLISERKPYFEMKLNDNMGVEISGIDSFTLKPGDVFHCYKVK